MRFVGCVIYVRLVLDGFGWVGCLLARGLLVQCCLLAGVSFGGFGVLGCLF